MTQRAANGEESTIEEIVALAVASLAEIPAEDLDLVIQKIREPEMRTSASSAD